MNKKIFFCFWVLIAALIFAADTATAQRPYAELSTDGKTLTFKVGTGTGYALPEDGYSPAWLLSGATSTVEEVVFEDIITPVTCEEWFHDFTALTTIRNIDNLHTENVRDMSYMFAGCSNLTVIDIRNFDFSSVTNMDWMFGGCSNLTTILVKESQLNGDGCLNIGNTVSHNNVFAYCYSLVGNTGTLYSRVDNAYYEALSAIDQLFDDRYSGGYLTVGNYKIFYDLSADDEIRLETVAGAPAEYEGGTEVSLPELDGSDELGQFKYWVRTSQNSSGNVVLGSSTMTVAAYETGNRIYSAKWTRSKEKYVYFESSNNTLYFRFDAKRPETNAYSLNEGSTTPSWLVHKDNIEKVVFETQMTPATCYKWFAGCSKLTAVDITNIKTTVLTNTESMFDGCSSLTAILVDNDQWGYLPNYYVNKSDNMFRGCSSLIGERGSWIDDYVDKTSAFAEEGDNGGFFTKDGYKIFCDLNGGELNGDPYDITLEYNDDVELGTPTQDGMSFAGWVRATSFDDSNYECVYATDASTTVIIPKNSGNYQFKATWGQPQPCAELSTDGKTLTFKVGDPYGTNCFPVPADNSVPAWVNAAKSTVEKVVFETTITPVSCNQWFAEFSELKEIKDMDKYLDTKNVSSYQGMFSWCSKLKSVDVSYFTPAADYAWMFSHCEQLENITLGNIVTDATSDIKYMFAHCSSLEEINVSGFVTTNVMDMSYLFDECSSLKSVNVSNFSTAKVTDMSYMFSGCSGLTTLDLSNFNTETVTEMGAMFKNCSSLETIKVGSGWNTVSSGDMFTNCTSLVGGNGTTFDAEHTDYSYAHIDGGPDNPGYLTAGNEPCVVYESNILTFYYGVRPTTANRTIYALNTGNNIPKWIEDHAADIYSVFFDASFQQTRPTTCFSWFAGCTQLTEITGMKEYLNTEKVEDMSKMFYNCQNLGKGTDYLKKINVADFKTENVTSMDEMFSGCSNTTSLDLGGFSFSSGKLNSVKKMFAGCSKLQTIYVSDNWVLPGAINATNSEDMFDGCTVLKGSSGTEYSTAGVKDATYAHADGGTSNPGYFSKGGYYAVYDNDTFTFKCGDKTSEQNWRYYTYDVPLDGSTPGWCGTDEVTLRNGIKYVVFDKSFDGARPTSCKNWFNNFKKLESMSGMQYFHTDEVKSMENMFHNCENLQSIDLGYFNTSQVENMTYMFGGCKIITVLNLETFDTRNVTSMNNMFAVMLCLHTIYVDQWEIKDGATTIEMFGNCDNLVGGAGTAFDETKDNGTYAKIDGGTSSPGYFTSAANYGYVVLNNGTLTFKKGRIPDNLQGTVFEVAPNTVPYYSGLTGSYTYTYHPSWVDHKAEIRNVVFEDGFHDVAIKTCGEWFKECNNLTSITGFANLNTSNVTDMSFMFFGCENLTTIDLVGLNTENVANFKTMFSGCKNLSTIDNISSLKTTNGVDFSSMFKDCENLGSIDIKGFNTANGTEFYSMFENCKKLETVDVSKLRFKSSDVTVSEMFMGCSRLTSIDISEWATLKNFQNLFSGCSSLTNVTVGNIVTETTEDIHGMFEGCSSLDDEAMANVIRGFINTSKVEDMSNLFKGCTSLTVLDISHFNTESITAMQHMFSDCPNLTTIKVGGGWSIDVNKIQFSYEQMDIFYNDISLIGNDGTVCDVTKYPIFVDVDYAKADDGGLLTSGDYYKIFYDLDADDGEIKVEPVAGAVDEYAGNSEVSLPTLDDSDERGEFLGWMRTSQDASGNVVLGSSTMTISAGETGNRIYSAKWTLTKEKYVYYEGSNNTLYFRFDANKPEGAYELNNGTDEPGWLAHSNDIENVVFETTFAPTTCYHWFAGCSKLKALDLRNLKTTNLTNTKSMFDGCTNLTAILVDDTQWEYTYINIDDNVTESENMFNGCTSLIGNNGGWIDYYIDKTFAIVDDGYGNGYLTKDNFKIFYDLDGGELNGESYPDPKEYSADVGLGIPTQEGYTFLGWARETSNGVFSDPSTTVTVAKNSGNYRFKAMWAEPYAELSADEQTLTFKYGVKPDGAYDLNEGENPPDWYTDGSYQNITKVKFDESFQNVRPTTCSKWFLAMSNLEEIEGLTNLNTSAVTCMGSMFTGCEKLTVLDLSSFSFSSTAESLKTNDMFEACTNLTTIIVGEGWDNTKITGTSENMFNGCSALIGNGGATVGATIDKTFATAEEGGYLTKDSYKIFYKWADDVTGAYQAHTPSTFTFSSTTSVEIENPTREGYKFLYWTQVSASGTQIGESSSSITIAEGDLGNRIYQMHWAVVKDYAYLSSDSKTLTFTHGAKPEGVNYFDLNGENTKPAWETAKTMIETVVFASTITPTSCYYWFDGFENLTTIENLENLHTENVTDMRSMFGSCKKLKKLDLRTFNTANVKYMVYMFQSCRELTVLDISSFDTQKAKGTDWMSSMFFGCVKLTTILIGPKWDAGNANVDIFTGTQELIGNDGTVYSTTKLTYEYAHANAGGLLTTGDYKIFYQWADKPNEYQAYEPSTFNGSVDVTIPNPERDGYKFLYWTRVSPTGAYDGGSSANLTIAAGEAGNRIYVMNWTALHKINLPAGWTAYAADDLEHLITSAPAGTKIVVKYTGTKPIKKVEVFPQPTSITLTPSGSQTLSVRGTLDLTCTITPDDVLDEDKEITWRSGNTSVATVTSNGKVTAVAVGETTITAETVNHKTATITIIVE